MWGGIEKFRRFNERLEDSNTSNAVTVNKLKSAKLRIERRRLLIKDSVETKVTFGVSK